MNVNRLTVTTPEQIRLSYEVAGIGSRFLALLIDTFIQAAVIILGILGFAAYAGEAPFGGAFDSWLVALTVIAVFVVLVGYHIIFEALIKGKTPGKAACGLRVVQINGQPLSISGALIRNILRLADILPVFYGVGVIVMFAGQVPRRAGDYAAGTIVVRERLKAVKSVDDLTAPAAEPAAANEYPLTPAEYGALKELLARRGTVAPEKYFELTSAMAGKLYDKFMIPETGRGNPTDFLMKVYGMNA